MESTHIMECRKLAENYVTVYGDSALTVACKDYIEGSLTWRGVLAILAGVHV